MEPHDEFSDFQPAGPIPAELHSAYERGPFRVCVHCSEVLTDGRVYEIQKVFRGQEVVFEMAVCHNCGEKMSREFSEESLERVQSFLVNSFKPSPKPEHCHFCGFPRGLFENYTFVGVCRETSLILPSIVMCDSCSEKLQELLSKKTRDIQDDFVRDHFPGVPADLDLSPTLSGLFP
jgi:hypothetical protein